MSRPTKAVAVCHRCRCRLYRMLALTDDAGRGFCGTRCRRKLLRDERKRTRRLARKS